MIGLVNFMWAVELMGRNSVSPSTMDRMMAWMIVIFGYAWVLGLSFRKIAKISTTNPARIRIGASGDPPKAIDLIFIEHIRVRALAAAHQDQAESDQCDADQHPTIIFFPKQGGIGMAFGGSRFRLRPSHGCSGEPGHAVLVAGSSRFFFCRCHENRVDYWACNIRESPFRPKYPQ